MKKEYIKPESTAVCVTTESMLTISDSEGMDSNETPGGDDAFNVHTRRGEWGNLWI